VTEYLVHTTGTVTVEAESEEEAEEKATFEARDRHEIEAAYPEPLNGEDQHFKLHLNQVGHTSFTAGYGVWTEKSAMVLGYQAVNAMAENFVGDHKPQYKFDLAIHLLASLEGDSVSKDAIWEAVQEAKEQGGEDMKQSFRIKEEDEEEGESQQ